MRRLLRWSFNLAAAVSAVLFLATCLLCAIVSACGCSICPVALIGPA